MYYLLVSWRAPVDSSKCLTWASYPVCFHFWIIKPNSTRNIRRGDLQENESGGEAQLLYIKSTPSGEAVSGNRWDFETDKPTLPEGEPRPLPIALRLRNVWPSACIEGNPNGVHSFRQKIEIGP